MRSVLRILAAVAIPTLNAASALSQSSIVGTVHDSLSRAGPLRGAVVVLAEKARYVSTDSLGAFRIDSVAPGRYTLALLHSVLDSFDLSSPRYTVEVDSGHVAIVVLATPSAATAYAQGCAARLAAVAKREDVVEYLRISRSCARIARRAAEQTALIESPAAPASGSRQALPAVVVRDSVRALSPLAMYGFEDRRRLGLGAFYTPEMMAKQHFESLPSLFSTLRGVKVEFGTTGEPTVYLRGTRDTYCAPNIFLDGALFYLAGMSSSALRAGAGGGGNLNGLDNRSSSASTAWRDLGGIAPPWMIKAIEVYASSGAIPAQFDYTSSTGCGSVVIWTR